MEIDPRVTLIGGLAVLRRENTIGETCRILQDYRQAGHQTVGAVEKISIV